MLPTEVPVKEKQSVEKAPGNLARQASKQAVLEADSTTQTPVKAATGGSDLMQEQM